MTFQVIEQIKNTVSRALLCLSNFFNSFFKNLDKRSTRLAQFFNSKIINQINRKVRKYRRCLSILFGILFFLGFVATLVMYSFSFAPAISQGIVIDLTSQTLKDTYYTNQYTFTGLGSDMLRVPKQKFIIEFNNDNINIKEQDIYNQIYPRIQARVSQGTKLMVSAVVQCQIMPANNNLKAFFDQFGFNPTANRPSELLWMTYIYQKIYNIIVKSVQSESFYSITVKELKTKINDLFLQMSTKYSSPFKLVLLSLSLSYPQNSFPQNNTLGVQIVNTNSLLAKLSNQQNQIQTYIKDNISNMNNTYTLNGIARAAMDTNLNKIRLYQQWFVALQQAKKIFAQSTTPDADLNKFMWLYFNSLYNQTYSNQRLSAINSINNIKLL